MNRLAVALCLLGWAAFYYPAQILYAISGWIGELAFDLHHDA